MKQREPQGATVKTTRKNVSELKFTPENPNKMRPEELEKLGRSIDEFGYVEPIVWNKQTGHVVGGNHRLRVLLARGVESVDVVEVDLSPEREKMLGIALNRIHGEFDPALLTELLQAMTPPERLLAGFSDLDLDRLLKEIGAGPSLADPDAIPEKPEPVAKPGDLFLLGEHRLMCGDSTKTNDVQMLMGGEQAVLFATDPPYLMGYTGLDHPHKWNARGKAAKKNKDWRGQYGVTWDENATDLTLYEDVFRRAMEQAILPNAAWYCWHASSRQAELVALWTKLDVHYHQEIVWYKDRPILTHSTYMWQHEPCLYGWRKGHMPPINRGPKGSSVWTAPTVKPGETTDHPTSKPVEVFRIPMKTHTNPGDVCFEPFAGSGSQIIAAEELGRRCFAMEIFPGFVDVCIARWEAFTGKKAVRC
jgi:DNA modification methylase